MKNRDASELINIGKIGSSVGLRGEVRVTLYAQDSYNLKEGKVLLLKHARRETGKNPGELRTVCRKVRYQKDRPVITLDGINDRNSSDSLRGMEIYITADELEELPEGEHYIRDITGFTVHDLASGENIGVLTDVIQNTAQNVLEVRTPEGRTVLIPAVDAFVRDISEDRELITVELIPGFL